MKVFCRQPLHVAIILLSLVVTGCLGGPSAPTNFYMLSPLVPSPAGSSPAAVQARILIGLETVVVPEYLNRNEIVFNLDNTVYQLADFNQWAEPLDDNLRRVFEENLTNLLGDASVGVIMTAESSIPLDYRLEIDVLRLDGNLGAPVTLVAQWALLEAEESLLKLMRRSVYQEQPADTTFKELVLAQSRTIEKLSRDIAAAIRSSLVR